MMKLRCLLADLLWERHMTPEALAEATGIASERVKNYCDDALTTLERGELEAILTFLDCDSLSRLFEVVSEPDSARQAVEFGDDEWHSRCPALPNGRHDWFKDMEVSNSIYQEYECRACGKRIHLIW